MAPSTKNSSTPHDVMNDNDNDNGNDNGNDNDNDNVCLARCLESLRGL